MTNILLYGEKTLTLKSLFEFYFMMSEPSGGSGGEGAPMVYADNVKDWNNLDSDKGLFGFAE